MKGKIFVSESSIGRGVFARTRIESGETIFYLTGREIDFDEAVASENGENSIQIGLNRYVNPHSLGKYPDSPARYINHSCSPNSGFLDEIRLVSLSRIRAGEEVRFDYSTTMLERYWEIDCVCGSMICRRRIRDFDLLPQERRQHYLELGIVPEYIVQYLATETSRTSRERRVA